jgi:hypothetical protein
MLGFGRGGMQRARVGRVRGLGRRGAALVVGVSGLGAGLAVWGSLLVFAGAASGISSCAAGSPYSKAVAGTSGMVSFWRLGDASGSSACDSVGTNTGAYQGGFTLGKPGAIVGDAGTATLLNGSTGDVSVPSATSLNTADAFSMEAWVKRG